jgi:hypothetical protein
MIDRIRLNWKQANTPIISNPLLANPSQATSVNSSVTYSGSSSHDLSRIAPFYQPKLSISQPGDAYEREADKVAQQVMYMGDRLLQQETTSSADPNIIQRREVCDDEGVCRSEPDLESNSDQEVFGPPAPIEQGNQPVSKVIDPDAQRLASEIEKMGGDCYDTSKVSYPELLAKYNELLAQKQKEKQKENKEKLPEAKQSRPEDIIEGRAIYYLDDTYGIRKVKSKYVRASKAELDEIEASESEKILQAEQSGLISGAKGMKGRIPNPGQSWRELEDQK